jgi:hypothetical protein
MDHRSKDSFYTSQLEQLGFYVGVHPAPGILNAVSLRASRRTRSDARLIDRSFKYDSVLDPDKLGVTDIYELDGTPCIYFKSLAADPTPEQVKAWHHAAWNHGLARMLWVCTPWHIRVFNAYAPPPEDVAGMESPEILLFTAVADRLADLKTQLLDRERIDSGEFWAGQLGQRVNRETRIDERLVKDLTLAAARLTERNLKPIEAHRLLLRTIFVAYLEAKGVLPPELFDGLGGTTFERVLGDPQTTETFFHRMHDVFNGDLFPPPPQQESLGKRWTPQQLEIAQCVLARTDLTSFQRSFNFWRYDFSVIPIELISSIYEKFIHAADPDKAKKAGTHYTPTNLVDFVLSQVFDDELFESRLPVDAKVVDLASGSGVFLVEAFRRLVARRLAAGEKHTRDLVRDTLYNQIYGIDIEETAIEIAAFSLCLTAFELDPVPNSRHQLRFKQQLKGRNLFADNAFDPRRRSCKPSRSGNANSASSSETRPGLDAKGPRSRSPQRRAVARRVLPEAKTTARAAPLPRSTGTSLPLAQSGLCASGGSHGDDSGRQTFFQPRGRVARRQARPVVGLPASTDRQSGSAARSEAVSCGQATGVGVGCREQPVAEERGVSLRCGRVLAHFPESRDFADRPGERPSLVRVAGGSQSPLR